MRQRDRETEMERGEKDRGRRIGISNECRNEIRQEKELSDIRTKTITL